MRMNFWNGIVNLMVSLNVTSEYLGVVLYRGVAIK
jgi:hypothetical protein